MAGKACAAVGWGDDVVLRGGDVNNGSVVFNGFAEFSTTVQRQQAFKVCQQGRGVDVFRVRHERSALLLERRNEAGQGDFGLSNHLAQCKTGRKLRETIDTDEGLPSHGLSQQF